MKTFQGRSPARSVAILVVGLFLIFDASPVEGRLRLGRGRRSGFSAQSLRRRLHINSLITEPGTAEVEFGNAFSVSSGSDLLPTVLKWTPRTGSGFWGRTELSLGLDAFSSSVESGQRANQFSDHLSVAATSVLYGGEKLNVAITPVALFYLRGDRGARLGGGVIARYNAGLTSAGLSLNWTAATTSSPSNPAGVLDLGGGYGRRLAASGFWGRLTPHANLVYERSSGIGQGLSVFEGLEYQLTEKLATDLSGQHSKLPDGSIDHEIVLGITLNLGYPRNWFRHKSSRLGSF